MSKSNKQLVEALKIAVERWRRADHAWASEFTVVCPHWQDHVPQSEDNGAEFNRIAALIETA